VVALKLAFQRCSEAANEFFFVTNEFSFVANEFFFVTNEFSTVTNGFSEVLFAIAHKIIGVGVTHPYTYLGGRCDRLQPALNIRKVPANG